MAASIYRARLLLLQLSVVLALGACGAGENATPAAPAQLSPTIYTSEGRLLNSCSLDPACSGNPYAPFFATATAAPIDGATLIGSVRLEVSGNMLGNVELLPAGAYLPRLGVFNLSEDRTRAWLDLDTTTLANGPLAARISAFDVAAEQPGAREIVAMSARSWTIGNPGATPAAFKAALLTAPADGAQVSGLMRLEIQGSGIANAELLPAGAYTPRLAVFNVSADKTRAWLDFDSASLPDGTRDVRISAYNLVQGQPGAQEIVAMPARRWQFRNGLPFSAAVSMAPAHGDAIDGSVRLEVRGSGIRNVELLPAGGYLPRLGTFNLAADGSYAWLDLDTATLPGGLLEARISAFDTPPEQAGAREIVAMPARQWSVRSQATAPAPAFQASLSAVPPDGATLCGIHMLEVRGSGMKNVELFTTDDLPATQGSIPGHPHMFTMLEDGGLARLWISAGAQSRHEVRVTISAYDAPAGQPAREIVVVKDRRWVIDGSAPSCDAATSRNEALERVDGVRPKAAPQTQCTRWTVLTPAAEPMKCISTTPRVCTAWTLYDHEPDGIWVTPEGLPANKLSCEPRAASNGMLEPGCICME